VKASINRCNLKSFTIKIPSFSQEVIEAALLRVHTLFPEADVSIKGAELEFLASSVDDSLDKKREISNILYRERIFEETNQIRSALFN